MAAPKSGRLFINSHGDCFIHSTAYFVKYWNFSLSQGGLGIVKVTILNPERVFLSCISPSPLPYENVRHGIPQRDYLEIDPKFAAELNISQETNVVLESVKSIERCLKLKVAPKDPSDYDLLCNNIEKINFELAERIRVVSCQQFFTFPVWINQDTVSVTVVSSEPSANWVMIVPDETMVELSRGTESEGDSAGLTTATGTTTTTNTTTTPEDSTENNSPTFMNITSNHFHSQGRSKSSVSAESSVDMNSSSYDNWGLHSIIQGARRLFEGSVFREPMNSGIQESLRESDDVIRTEPGRETDKRHSYHPFSFGGESTASIQSSFNAELRDKLGSTLCVRGSNTISEPMISPKKGDTKHTRTPTWHSEMQFTSPLGFKKERGRESAQRNRLSAYVATPRMSANLRVQPHRIRGVKTHSELSSASPGGFWCHERRFDVFVHPSTLPEMYSHSETDPDGDSFLVELIPLTQPNKYVLKNPESSTIKNDAGSLDTSNGGGGRSQDQSREPSLPSSLVVRLCFATWITVGREWNRGTGLSDLSEVNTYEGEDKKRRGGYVIKVQVGQVVMSDLVRQQLKIKECSRVQLLDVRDRWKMSFVDGIKVVLHPIKYNKRDNYKSLLTSFRDWVKVVSDVSKFGVALVDKQVLVLRDSNGEWVNCQLKVTSDKLVQKLSHRVSYCLLTYSDYDRRRFTAMIDSVSSRGPLKFRRSQEQKESVSRYEETPGEESAKLPDMIDLNQQVITETPDDFGAFKDILTEAHNYLRTVLSGQRRCGTLLVCGMSGSAGAGCGKTSLIKLIAAKALDHPHYAFVKIHDCTSLRGQTTTRTKKRLLSLFSEAIQNQPSVLLLEDLDHAMPLIDDAQEQVQEEGTGSINRTQVFKDLLHNMRCKEAQVLLIATAQNKQQLNRELLTSQGKYTFDRVLEILPPTLADRKEILEAILHKKKIPSLADSDLRAVASVTEGYQAGDLMTLVDRAVSHSELRVLCPTHSASSGTLRDSLYKRMSIESGSDLDLSTEYSSSPQKAGPMHNFNTLLHKHSNTSNSSDFDSGISNPTSPINCPPKKKTSEVSASALTPIAPRSFERSLPPIYRAGSLSQMVLTVSDFLTALDGFVPVSLRGLPLHKSGIVDFSHIGGLEVTKQKLKETLLWPSKYPRLFSQCTIKQRRGVLLYGPPGTGKTMLAGAVAKEFGLNFVSVKGPELLSKYIGASEKAVRDIFTRALSARPCILFFDEFDSLAPRRGHDNTGVTDRVVNQLLTQLDGVESLEGVYVLAASSRPDLIDPALLRPGRIDTRLFCNIPDENERFEILRALSKDVKISVDVNFREIAKPSYTEHFTGADIKALLYNTQLQAVHTFLDERKNSLDSSSQLSLSMNSESSFENSSEHLRGASPMVFSFSESGCVERQSIVPKDVEVKVALLQNKLRKRRNTLVSSSKEFLGERRTRSTSMKHQVVLTQDLLLINATHEVRPSVSREERKKYSKIYEKFTGRTEIETTPLDIKPMVTLA